MGTSSETPEPGKAGRYTPDELSGLDLAAPDERLAWAVSAKASSEYSSSYAAREACGSPAVFPKGGDEYRTWLAESSDAAPWLEVELAPCEGAVALLVCETCGPGAVRAIRDLERDVELWAQPPKKLKPTRTARLLCVPLGEHPPPRRIRLELAPYAFGSEYHEIDAVGLSTVPLETLRTSPPGDDGPAHERLAPAAVGHLDLRDDPRVHWAKRARASSEWSSSYAAKKAVGRPRVFPRGGDIENTWLAEGRGRDEWLELEFAHDGPVHGLIVLETCGAGSVYKITDEDGALLWGARPEPVPEREARLLHVALSAARAPKKLRVWVAANDDYREIDAVALLSAPFETLDQPAPPPPPPGRPEEGWTELSGTLVGDLPFVHAVLRTSDRGRAANAGGPLRLRLPSGEELPVETGRTALLGVALKRARGRWVDVAAELPWAAAAFGDVAVDPDAEITLEGRRVGGDVTVEVLGDGVGIQTRGGFRESGRPLPERVIAAAIAVGSREDFDELGADAFSASAIKLEVRPTAPHPLRGMLILLVGAALVSAAALGVSSFLDDATGTLVYVLALPVLLFSGVLALEHIARSAFIPAFLSVPGASFTDRTVVFRMRPLPLFGNALLFGMAVIPVAAFIELTESLGAIDARVIWVVGAGYALVRLGLWLFVALRPLREALPIAFAREVPSVVGATGRLSGTLGSGPFTRHMRLAVCSEHLGTQTTTDDAGNTVTHERYRTWCERRVTARAPKRLRVISSDGRVARVTGSPRTTDVGLRSRPAAREDIGCFESLHEEGDPATVVGVVEAVDGGLELRATHLVLGRIEVLRRRVLLHLGVLVGLAAVSAVAAAFAAGAL